MYSWKTRERLTTHVLANHSHASRVGMLALSRIADRLACVAACQEQGTLYQWSRPIAMWHIRHYSEFYAIRSAYDDACLLVVVTEEVWKPPHLHAV
jgi:hypothetical protein